MPPPARAPDGAILSADGTRGLAIRFPTFWSGRFLIECLISCSMILRTLATTIMSSQTVTKIASVLMEILALGTLSIRVSMRFPCPCTVVASGDGEEQPSETGGPHNAPADGGSGSSDARDQVQDDRGDRSVHTRSRPSHTIYGTNFN
jgi:hypothetical protein